MRTTVILYGRLLLIMMLFTACGKTDEEKKTSLDTVTVQLRWSHQAQFAGYYAADQNGYYADEGLSVTFLEGGANIDPLPSVLDDTAQFGITNQDLLILARADAKPLRAVAVIFRRSPGVYISLADLNILQPQDFAGKTIAVGRNGRPLLRTLMAKVGVSPDQYTVVDATPNDLTQLYSGQVQVRSVFLTNEVLTAQAAGYELNFVFPDDYGIHLYNDILFTTEDLIATNPDLVLRFVRATLRGWRWAVENPAKAGPLALQYAPALDAALQVAQMEASVPLIHTGEDQIGWMRSDVWDGAQQLLLEQGLLDQPIDLNDAYTMQFLEEVYEQKP